MPVSLTSCAGCRGQLDIGDTCPLCGLHNPDVDRDGLPCPVCHDPMRVERIARSVSVEYCPICEADANG